MSLCTSDWMKLNTGDVVRERDGRHLGRIEAIFHGAFVRVRWHDTGWLSTLALDEIERVRSCATL